MQLCFFTLNPKLTTLKSENYCFNAAFVHFIPLIPLQQTRYIFNYRWQAGPFRTPTEGSSHIKFISSYLWQAQVVLNVRSARDKEVQEEQLIKVTSSCLLQQSKNTQLLHVVHAATELICLGHLIYIKF